MRFNRTSVTLSVLALAGLVLAAPMTIPTSASAGYPLLGKLIVAYNLEAHKQSLEDGSYRGEEGLLLLTPKAAGRLGVKAFTDQNFLDAESLIKQAHENLNAAKASMTTRKKETSPGEHTERIAKHFLSYKKAMAAAEEKFRTYHENLTPATDERLDPETGTRLLNRLLEESLKATGHRLRDALGRFYNLCRGNRHHSGELTSGNVLFVNDIFLKFTKQAPQETLKRFNLDRDSDYADPTPGDQWKRVMEKEGFPFISQIETSVALRKEKDDVDPLLFLALIKRESRFDPMAVSSVGAAGLTQIMPQTALDLGMKNIYSPPYFQEAMTLIKEERKLRKQAMKTLFDMDATGTLEHAGKARSLMQRSLELGKKKEKLFRRYQREMAKRKNDDRLKPSPAIKYGYRYFARMMKEQQGDISLALASYNAGPHRVREYGGIPPYRETVRFRNLVLKFYREYLHAAKHLAPRTQVLN